MCRYNGDFLWPTNLGTKNTFIWWCFHLVIFSSQRNPTRSYYHAQCYFCVDICQEKLNIAEVFRAEGNDITIKRKYFEFGGTVHPNKASVDFKQDLPLQSQKTNNTLDKSKVDNVATTGHIQETPMKAIVKYTDSEAQNIDLIQKLNTVSKSIDRSSPQNHQMQYQKPTQSSVQFKSDMKLTLNNIDLINRYTLAVIIDLGNELGILDANLIQQLVSKSSEESINWQKYATQFIGVKEVVFAVLAFESYAFRKAFNIEMIRLAPNNKLFEDLQNLSRKLIEVINVEWTNEQVQKKSIGILNQMKLYKISQPVLVINLQQQITEEDIGNTQARILQEFYETFSSQGCSTELKEQVVQQLVKQFLHISKAPVMQYNYNSVRMLTSVLPYIEQNVQENKGFSTHNLLKMRNFLDYIVQTIGCYNYEQVQQLNITSQDMSQFLVSILKYDYARYSQVIATSCILQYIQRQLEALQEQTLDKTIQISPLQEIPDWLWLLNIIEEWRYKCPDQLSTRILSIFQRNLDLAQVCQAEKKDVVIKKSFFNYSSVTQYYKKDVQALNKVRHLGQVSPSSDLRSIQSIDIVKDKPAIYMAVQRLHESFLIQDMPISQKNQLLRKVLGYVRQRVENGSAHSRQGKPRKLIIVVNNQQNKTIQQLQHCIKQFIEATTTALIPFDLDVTLLAYIVCVGSDLNFIDDFIVSGIQQIISIGQMQQSQKGATCTSECFQVINVMTSNEFRSKFKLRSLKKDGSSKLYGQLQTIADYFGQMAGNGDVTCNEDTILQILQLFQIYNVKSQCCDELIIKLQGQTQRYTSNLLYTAVQLNYKGAYLPSMISDFLNKTGRTINFNNFMVYATLLNYHHAQESLNNQLVQELEQTFLMQIDWLAQLDTAILHEQNIHLYDASEALLLLMQIDYSSSNHEAACQTLIKYIEHAIKVADDNYEHDVDFINNIINTQKIRQQRKQAFDGKMLLLALVEGQLSNTLAFVDQELLIYADKVMNQDFGSYKELLQAIKSQIKQNQNRL